MQVYKVFFRILKRHLGQVIMYLGIFLGIAMIVSNQGGAEKMFESTKLSFAVFNEDSSEISKSMVAFLEKHHERVEIKDDKETIQDEIYNRNVECVLRIPKGFGEGLLAKKDDIKLDIKTVPGTFYEEAFKSLINRYLSLVQSYQAGGFSEREAIEKASKISETRIEVSMAEGAKGVSHSRLYYFFAYLPYIFISVCVVGIGPILVIFNRKEVQERNNCSAYTLLRTNVQLFAVAITTGIALCVCYCIMAAMGSRENLFTYQGMLYCLNMLSFLVVSLGLVFLLGQTVKKQEALSMISNVVALGMSFLGGIFVPLELLGDGIVKVAHFLPSYWYITAADFADKYKAGESLEQFFIKLLVQLLFGVALFSIGLAYSKVKQGNTAAK